MQLSSSSKTHFYRNSLKEPIQFHQEEYKNQNCLDSAEHDRSEQEMRILDFLQEKGIEFKSPWEKMYDYFDEQRKRRLSEMHSNVNRNIPSQSKKIVFRLSSSLYHTRIKHNTKSSSESP